MNKTFFCPVCNQRNSFVEKLILQTQRKEIINKKFIYYSCTVCSFWLLKPNLTKGQLKKIYDREYYPDLEKPHANQYVNFLLNLKLFSSYESFVQKYGEKQILDIGCGTGKFLKKMQVLGYDVYGLDPYKPAVINTSKKIGENRVFLGDISKLLNIKKKFETITMWHVLEHVDSPFAELKVLYKKLKKKGRLVIEVPNANSFVFSFFKKDYNWLMIPEHNHYFTNKSLQLLFFNTNFIVIKQYCPPKALTNFAQSFKNMLIGQGYNKYFIQVVFFLSIPISVIVTIFFSLLGKGEVIRVVAERHYQL